MNTKNTLIAIVALFATTATFAQVGINTTTPHASAALDVESTTMGFLPPRMTDAQRDAIATYPAEGLTIFNTTENCLQWYNGSGWYNASDGSVDLFGGGFTHGFEDNTTCTTTVISVTSCASVAGATLNDDTGTTDGTEYDWTDATSYMGGTTTRALVEIGGQCWFGRNTITPPTYTGTNDWNGFYGTFTSEPAVGEGRLYQWSAAMNGDSTERAQGVCPTGWHIPSDCEWMYLEDTLGMSTANQQAFSIRSSGGVGSKLSTLTVSPTNSSGFTGLLVGRRGTSGASNNRSIHDFWWTSSELSSPNVVIRYLANNRDAVIRQNYVKADGFSVRCLKD